MNMQTLYGKDSIELYELIDGAKYELNEENIEYSKLMKQYNEIKNKYLKIKMFYEGEIIDGFNTEECNALQNLNEIQQKLHEYEEREIFMLGARENFLYLKKLKLI